MEKALHLYREFHSYDPVRVGQFSKGFRIPREGKYVGEAKTMYYTSDKLNPVTGEDEGHIQYYHPHEGGVRLYLTDSKGMQRPGGMRRIPKWIYGTKELVRLGDFDGFDYEDFDGEMKKAEGIGRLPEWYAIPSGKALLVIQDKRFVQAILWGGDLRVEWRGVVG